MSDCSVILKPRKAQPFFARHPWVFAGAIDRTEGSPQDGQAVVLRSHAGNFIAHGLLNRRSKIVVRLYSWDEDRPLDRSFFQERIQQAIQLRDALKMRGPNQACRLLFSESDYLSGVTIDEYDRWLVVQFSSLGLFQRRDMLIEILNECIRPQGIYTRIDKTIGVLEGITEGDQLLSGEPPPSPIRIRENNLDLLVHPTEGQKTGTFLDQRDNHRLIMPYAHGRRVLDAFCYAGGFALHAAQAGAIHVDAVDSSAPALELARANAQLNGLGQIQFHQADVFDYLQQAVEQSQKYDMVILDPPKFARNRNTVDEALKGYRRLQTLAFRLLSTHGILVMCCCSGSITTEMLQDLLAQIATHEKRAIQLLSSTGPAPDHPVSLQCPESAYLKCLISRVA